MRSISRQLPDSRRLATLVSAVAARHHRRGGAPVVMVVLLENDPYVMFIQADFTMLKYK